MTASPPRGLRARRRQETSEEIHEAALALFEAQGVQDTTVHQIADRAGVSPRTFFRYFASKEVAALPGQRQLLDAVSELRLPAPGAAPEVLAAVVGSLERLLATDDPVLEEHRRVSALLAEEPVLRAAAASQEVVMVSTLRDRLAAEAPHLDPTTVLLLAGTTVMLWRSAWQLWAESPDRDRRSPAWHLRVCAERLCGLTDPLRS